MGDADGGSALQSEEAARDARLVRGLRVVAAAVIVGGIVIAAFETDASSTRTLPEAGPMGQDDAYGVVAPALAPTVAPMSAGLPWTARVDVALIDGPR